jgi:hypothetical protein
MLNQHQEQIIVAAIAYIVNVVALAAMLYACPLYITKKTFDLRSIRVIDQQSKLLKFTSVKLRNNQSYQILPTSAADGFCQLWEA